MHCNGSGYSGRQALFEYVSIDSNLHREIMLGSSAQVLQRVAAKNGMVTMADFARRAVVEGLTTVAEIKRTILAEEGREHLCNNCNRLVNAEFDVCPYCQSRLREKCEDCGSQVDASWEACPNCGHEIDREWQQIYCRKCFAPVKSDWDCCPYCDEEIK